MLSDLYPCMYVYEIGESYILESGTTDEKYANKMLLQKEIHFSERFVCVTSSNVATSMREIRSKLKICSYGADVWLNFFYLNKHS